MIQTLQSSTVSPSPTPSTPVKNSAQEVGPVRQQLSPAHETMKNLFGSLTSAQSRNLEMTNKVVETQSQANAKSKDVERLEKQSAEKDKTIKTLTEHERKAKEETVKHKTENAILKAALKAEREETLTDCFHNGVEAINYDNSFLDRDYVRHLPYRRHVAILGVSGLAGLAAASQAEGVVKKVSAFVSVVGISSFGLFYFTDPDSRVIKSMKKAREKCKKQNILWQPSKNLPKEGTEFFNLVKVKYGSSWYSRFYTSSTNQQILQLLADEVPETTLYVATDTAATALPANTAAASTAPPVPKTASIPAQRPNLGAPLPVPNIHQMLPPALPTDRLPLPSVITQSAAGAAK